MEYRNTRTGVVITVSSEISGEGWEPVKKAPTPAVLNDEKPEAPKRTRVKK